MLIKKSLKKATFHIGKDEITFVLPKEAHPNHHVFEALCTASNTDPDSDKGKSLWSAKELKVSTSIAFSEDDIKCILEDFESLTRRDELLWDLDKKTSLIQYDVESEDDDDISEVSFYNHLGGGIFQLSTNISLKEGVVNTLVFQGANGNLVELEMNSQIFSKMAEKNIEAIIQFQAATILNGLLERPLLTISSSS